MMAEQLRVSECDPSIGDPVLSVEQPFTQVAGSLYDLTLRVAYLEAYIVVIEKRLASLELPWWERLENWIISKLKA